MLNRSEKNVFCFYEESKNVCVCVHTLMIYIHILVYIHHLYILCLLKEEARLELHTANPL